MNKKNYVIRLERKEERREVENLVREAFWNVYHTPKGYYVDEREAEQFDAAFPPKRKLKLSGQLG